MKKSSEFIDGIKKISPILLGIFPFAIVSGIAAIDAGLSRFTAIAMSIIVYAGASQLAALHLIKSGAPFIIIILTAFIINLRFIMYSASIGQYFKKISLKWKALNSYLLTDQAYAISIIRFNEDNNIDNKHSHWFYFGAGATIWIAWEAGTLVGIFLGTKFPESWSLDFAVPLTFSALLAPAIKDKASIITAITAGIMSVISVKLPYNINIIAAAIIGIGAGLWAEKEKGEKNDR